MHRYGFHQDELLYMTLGEHLNWGFSETPPFIAIAAIFTKTFIGDSVFAMRVLPSIAAALIIFFTGLIAIKLGGKTWAVILACSGITFSSAFLATGSLFIPQVFDELCWVLVAYAGICWIKNPRSKYLLLLGLVLGVGMMVKYTMALYGTGIFIGLLCVPATRKIFADRKFWIGLLIAFIICLPNLLWQVQHDFPEIIHYRELRETQLRYISSVDFLIQQLFVNGTGVILWAAGIFLLFRKPEFRNFRFLAIAYGFVILLLVALNGKSYYAFGAYPPLFAAGAVYFEQYSRMSRINRKLFFTGLLVPNLLLMAIVLPYLPIEKAAKVFEWSYVNLHIHFPLKWEDQKIHNMNQNYADMIGWDELAAKTSEGFEELSMEEQKNTIVYTDNYGEAGALDYYKKDFDLPPLVSLNSSFSVWAPPHIVADNMIYISSVRPPNAIGRDIRKLNEITNPYARIRGLDIYLIKGVQKSFKRAYRLAWVERRTGKSQVGIRLM